MVSAFSRTLPPHAPHLALLLDDGVSRDLVQRILLQLQMDGPAHMVEGFANGARADGEENAGVEVVQHEREVRPKPLRLRKHPRCQVA